MTSHTDHGQSRRQWFIQVDGQAYGPFDDKTLWSYMVEGRVNAQSLISQNANTGLGNSVWILQAQTQAKTLRDVLSQPLGAEDRLFVLDSFANETAWFNLSPEMDAQIAQFWTIDR